MLARLAARGVSAAYRSRWAIARVPLPKLTTPITGPIISLTSSPTRWNFTLPLTLRSLTRQSLPPSLIAVYLPFARPDSLPAIFHHPLIRPTFLAEGEDLGPASKLLLILRELLQESSAVALDQRIIVVDDDHVYTSELVRRLVEGFEKEGGTSAVGLRGWRVREDCVWGVGWEDYQRHVVEGWRLATDSYRVGVLTANEASSARGRRQVR